MVNLPRVRRRQRCCRFQGRRGGGGQGPPRGPEGLDEEARVTTWWQQGAPQPPHLSVIGIHLLAFIIILRLATICLDFIPFSKILHLKEIHVDMEILEV